MSVFSKFNIGEVTRLTKAGKLAEAVALLRRNMAIDAGQDGPGSSERRESEGMTPPRRLLDMAPPPSEGGAWTASDPARRGSARSTRVIGEDRPPYVAPRRQRFRAGLFDPGSFPAMDGNLGARRRPSVAVPPGARFEERAFAGDAGGRTFKVYVPSGYSGQPLPVVVMLHGCTQDPDDFAAGTRMNDVAEEQTFLVAYPRQPQSANMQKCWNWFNAADQQRGAGEPSIIAGIAAQVVVEFSADPSRVYVAGLSAGGAAAAIMAATYPDVFAAVGVHSGLACGAARDMPSAFAAMKGGGAIGPRGAGPVAPTIVFHGDADRTVNFVNGDRVAAQAMPQAALTEVVTQGAAPDGMTYTRIVQLDGAGRDVLEQWVLHGGGHAWSGGSANGSYADPRGPDASREMVRFFLQHSAPGQA